MRESKFITEVKNSIFEYGGWAYKLADLPASMTPGLRYSPDKPCDLIASINGKCIGIECKMLRKYEAFGLRHLRESQVRGLDGIIQRGLGRGFVFLNIRRSADKEYGIKRLNRLIIFDWEIFSCLTGTIKKNELENYDYIQGKNGMFAIQDWVMDF